MSGKLYGRWIGAAFLCGLLFLLAPAACAEGPARELTGEALVTAQDGMPKYSRVFSSVPGDTCITADGASLTLSSDEGIASLYLEFNAPYGPYTITDEETGRTEEFGQNRYLHDFADIREVFGSPLSEITIHFDTGKAAVNLLRVFSSGEVPGDVQRWTPAVEGQTDLMLFSTHCDDEQLFFAGILPYYAGQLGYQVQVVFLTNHYNVDPWRLHEMLDGLWAVGVTYYPVIGTFPDFLTKNIAEAYRLYGTYGITKEDLTAFAVEQIRRYKPLVAIGHDTNGEYGHGQHKVYSEVLMDASLRSFDPSQFPESAETYGVWDVPKTYLHLYPENPVEMDWDLPLSRFSGMTAYQVTRDLGFPCYGSQYRDFWWFYEDNPTAASVRKYSPCRYGLFRSKVGEDLEKDDFFENVLSYTEQNRIAQEQVEAEEAAAAVITEEHVLPETEPAAVMTQPPSQGTAAALPDTHSRYYALGAAVIALAATFALVILIAGKSFLEKK